jgi:thiosulfate/3-mercaptopyruvate sulfurtransferase
MHHSCLISPTWLSKRIGKNNFLIIEVGTGEHARYLQAHIPTAIYLDTNTFERALSWNIVPDAELEQVLLAHGITYRKSIILYGRNAQAVGRAALLLLYAGVREVHWLQGGCQAWQACGHAMEAGARSPLPAGAFGCQCPAHPEYIVNLRQVRAMLSDPGAVVACVRTWQEYTGDTSGYDYIQPKGRIAGSQWAGGYEPPAPLAPNGDFQQQTVQRCRELAAAWWERGVTPDKRIAFYCGTGWRASVAFFYAYMMGWENICVYDGGWLEWSADSDNPIEVGAPE